LPVSQVKMTFQEIRIIATGPCIASQLRDVNTIYLVKPFCRDDNKRWIFIKYCVDYYYTYFVPVLLKMLLQWQPEPFNRNGSGGFGAVQSDSINPPFLWKCLYQVRKKASRQLNVLKRIGQHLTKLGRLTIYCSFIMSNFNYCPIVWHFCLFVNLWVLPFPLEVCSVFGNFVITLIYFDLFNRSSYELL
jgi:hypothetical protein